MQIIESDHTQKLCTMTTRYNTIKALNANVNINLRNNNVIVTFVGKYSWQSNKECNKTADETQQRKPRDSMYRSNACSANFVILLSNCASAVSSLCNRILYFITDTPHCLEHFSGGLCNTIFFRKSALWYSRSLMLVPIKSVCATSY